MSTCACVCMSTCARTQLLPVQSLIPMPAAPLLGAGSQAHSIKTLLRPWVPAVDTVRGLFLAPHLLPLGGSGPQLRAPKATEAAKEAWVSQVSRALWSGLGGGGGGRQEPITQTQRHCEPLGGGGKVALCGPPGSQPGLGRGPYQGRGSFLGRGLPSTISAHPKILAPLEASSHPWRGSSCKDT